MNKIIRKKINYFPHSNIFILSRKQKKANMQNRKINKKFFIDTQESKTKKLSRNLNKINKKPYTLK